MPVYARTSSNVYQVHPSLGETVDEVLSAMGAEMQALTGSAAWQSPPGDKWLKVWDGRALRFSTVTELFVLDHPASSLADRRPEPA